jgi:hypothetical protein
MNGRQLATNGRQPVTNGRQPVTNGRRPASCGGPPLPLSRLTWTSVVPGRGRLRVKGTPCPPGASRRRPMSRPVRNEGSPVRTSPTLFSNVLSRRASRFPWQPPSRRPMMRPRRPARRHPRRNLAMRIPFRPRLPVRRRLPARPQILACPPIPSCPSSPARPCRLDPIVTQSTAVRPPWFVAVRLTRARAVRPPCPMSILGRWPLTRLWPSMPVSGRMPGFLPPGVLVGARRTVRRRLPRRLPRSARPGRRASIAPLHPVPTGRRPREFPALRDKPWCRPVPGPVRPLVPAGGNHAAAGSGARRRFGSRRPGSR